MAHEWHKSRIYGSDPDEAPDKIFDRVKLLMKPRASDTLPIFFEESPSKDQYFPLQMTEIESTIQNELKTNAGRLTHVWLRKPKASEFRNGRIPLSEYIYADELCLMIFYPWPETRQFPLLKKPTDAVMNRYRRWSTKLSSHKGKWHLEWSEESARDFFEQDLLKNLLQLHIDFQQKLSQAPDGRLRNGAPIQYANQRFFEQTQSYS